MEKGERGEGVGRYTCQLCVRFVPFCLCGGECLKEKFIR